MLIRDELKTLRSTIEEARKIVTVTVADTRVRDLLESAQSQIDTLANQPSIGDSPRRKGLVRVRARA